MKKVNIFMIMFVVLIIMGSSVFAEDAKIIRFGTLYAPSTPTGIATAYFKELVEDKTNNSIEVQVFYSQQMGTEEEMVEAVSIGALEMTNPGTGLSGRFSKEYQIFPVVFTFDDWDHLKKVVEGPIGKEMADKFQERTGIKVLASNWFREPRFLCANRPINSVSDLKGLRIRVPENPVWIASWKKLGAQPTPIAAAEIYTSIQQGIIDGAETTISYNYNKGFYRLAPYIMTTEHVYETNLCLINNAFYESLSAKEQQAVSEAALEAGERHKELVRASIGTVKQKMADEGATIVEINRKEWIDKAEGLGYELEYIYGEGLYEKIRALAGK
jgi:tripartite ATP-independent transporter DctP family solute receptor